MDESRIEALMKGIDRTLLRENLRLTPTQRLEKFVSRVRVASQQGAELESCRPVETKEEKRRRNLETIAELRVLLEETLRQS
jgi:hypothetical protein